ncbi:MAG TPA: ATP-binding protein [Roseiflexaceae bacterium]|nr:ATP-binding protein [Roseiflexaceae bacterium]
MSRRPRTAVVHADTSHTDPPALPDSAGELTEAYRRLAEGREEERLHLAQDLHDGPVQDLYGILFDLGNLARQVDQHEIHVSLLALCEMTEHVIQALRTTCGELRPPVLAPFGLEVAIRAHAQHIRESHPQIAVQLELMHDGTELPERTRLALFRIYQEAMNNAIQHAAVQELIVRLVLEPEQVRLEVQDDGCGFETNDSWLTLACRGHLGLLGISERAAALGGRTEILSAVGRGTLVRATVPRLCGEAC